MENKKKILIAAEIFPPDIGGPATYSYDLAHELARRGFTIGVVCYGEGSGSVSGFNIYKISRNQNIFSRYIKYIFALYKYSKDFDIIYAQGPIASGIPAYIINNIFKKKYIVKVVGDYAWEKAMNSGKTKFTIDEFQNEKSKGVIKVLRYLEALVCKNAIKVIAPSRYLKKIVEGWGITGENIEVIYNAFGIPHREEKLEKNKNLILSVGRLVPWKGFSLLIEIMPELLKFNKNFKLMIFGFGPELLKLQNMIHEMKLGEHISISCVKHDKVIELMSCGGIFVLNTGYEGLSHTLLDALASKIPVITTNIGGNPEIIRDSYNGLLVEYNNKAQIIEAIKKIFTHIDLQKKFSDNSNKTLRQFSFEIMIQKTINLLETL